MLKKSITYVDYNGVERTEDFYFNLSKAETLGYINSERGGVEAFITKAVETEDNVKLWNPRATKASVDFAYSMGLKSKKPLRNIAEILYSYAYLELQEENLNECEISIFKGCLNGLKFCSRGIEISLSLIIKFIFDILNLLSTTNWAFFVSE